MPFGTVEQPYLKVASALRMQILKEDVFPEIEYNFKQDPKLNSVLMLLGQFWNDEANDAVQARLLYSELETPDLNAYFQSSELDQPDKVNRSQWDPEQAFFELDYVSAWDPNYRGIIAFACFCKSQGSQSQAERDLFTSYALFRKTEQAVLMEVIGRKYQPWLEGIRPEWDADAKVEEKSLKTWHSLFRQSLKFPVSVNYEPRYKTSQKGLSWLELANLSECLKAGKLIAKTDQGKLALKDLGWKDPRDPALFYEYLSWQSKQILLLKPISEFSHGIFELIE